MVRNVQIGGGAPVAVQSMTKTDTTDVDGTIKQIEEMVAAGCEIVRVAVPDNDAAIALKEIIALAILLLTGAAFASVAEAKTAGKSVNAPQIRIQVGQNRRNNRRATRTYTRNVRVGRQIFRETYRVVYRANGTTRTQLISRVRIGRY